MKTQFDPKVLLDQPLMAMLATSCAAGPRIAPMWFIWEDGALWLPSATSSSSVARLSADDRVAVEIVSFNAPDGVLLHLGMRGRADVVAMDVPLFKRLLAKYLGPQEAAWNPWFIENIASFDDPSGRFIRLHPASIFTNNASFFQTGPEMAWP